MEVLQVPLRVLGGKIGYVPLGGLVLGSRWVLVGDVRRDVGVAAALVRAVVRNSQLFGWYEGVLGVSPLVILVEKRGGALVLHGVNGLGLLL